MSETVPQQLRHAGSWYDAELGWYWLSVRAYDPALERFLQPDPSEKEGLFSYAYAGDNPADRTDPSGLVATPPQAGCLLTRDGNIECNVQIGSPQWNAELANGATQISSIDGAPLAGLLPILCGHTRGVCLITLRPHRTGAESPASFSCGPFGGVCHFVGDVVGAVGDLVVTVWNGLTFLCDASICGDVNQIRNGPWYMKILGAADILITFVPGGGEVEKAGEILIRSTVDLSAHGAEEEAARIAETVIRDCITQCFPAGTLVTTPQGSVPIERIRVGDAVLTEDLRTGKVEAEQVRAVHHDSPAWVMAIDLADGSTLKVTPEHPFWVDRGVNFRGPGWLKAGELRIGDQLRTPGGADATVVALRYHVERVAVYTLTLGTNHDFFVGTARVLVHNASCNLPVEWGENLAAKVKKHWQDLRQFGGLTGKFGDPGSVEEAQKLITSIVNVQHDELRIGGWNQPYNQALFFRQGNLIVVLKTDGGVHNCLEH